MEDLTKKQVGYLVFSLILLALFFPACGGSDNPSSSTNATITGTVPGTVVVAIDGNGKEITRNTASGSPKTFTLHVPVGHNYRFYFCENEYTPQQKACYLYQDTTNIFQINSAATIDLGFVDTSSGKGVPTNNPLNVSGVAPGGENSSIWIWAPFTGTWVGTITIPAGALSIDQTVTLTQDGGNITGNWRNADGGTGTIIGTVSGNTINWTSTETSPGCPGTISGTYNLSGSTAMSTTFAASDCHGTYNGQGSFTWQQNKS